MDSNEKQPNGQEKSAISNNVPPVSYTVDSSDREEKGSNFYVYYLTCFATIGGLLFGYDTGIISGSLLLIGDKWKLETIWKEAIVSATVGAAAVFSLIAGLLTDLIGRKKVIMIASVVFTGGAVCMGAAPNKEVLLAGRLIVGAGIGFVSMSVPVYVAEAAPSNIRGRLVTINQLFITIGIVISSVVAGLFSVNKEDGFRYMLGLAGIPSVIQFVGFIFLPESPRWLVEKGREDDARRALQKIRKLQNVEHELNEIKEVVAEHRKEKEEAGSGVYVRLFKTQPVRRALFLGCGMQLFQQLCGINTVIYYSASILKLAGFPSELAIWLVCVVNGVNFLATFIGIALVERMGRRILTLLSLVGIMISLAVLAVGFQLSSIHTPTFNKTEALDVNECFKYTKCEPCTDNSKCGFCYIDGSPKTSGSCLKVDADFPERYASNTPINETIIDETIRCTKNNLDNETWNSVWADSYCPTDYTWMAVLGLALFVLGFAPGLGPMPWTVNAEIYPTWARGAATSLATATNWVFNLIVSLTFLTLTENITKYGTFWLFFGITFLGFLFMFFLLPETKNKSLEEVEELFMSEDYKKKMQAKQPNITDTKF